MQCVHKLTLEREIIVPLAEHYGVGPGTQANKKLVLAVLSPLVTLIVTWFVTWALVL